MHSCLKRIFAQPLIQAPMVGVSTPQMAAAVSNAGGLGSLGIGASPVAAAQDMIEETRGRTSAAFNVNVFCHPPPQRDSAVEAEWLEYLAPIFHEFGFTPPAALKEIYKSFVEDEEAFRMLLIMRPKIVSFHFGLPPQDRINAMRDAGILTMATATNVDEVRLIEAAGIDVVVAQGVEAGGHRGQFALSERDLGLSLSVLIRLAVRSTRLPVIAAGGIMDVQGVRAALALGAAAVQMGTAFVLCPESAADSTYRAALKSERAIDTRLTSAISGRPARGIANRFMEIGAMGPPVPSYPVAYDVGKRLHTVTRAKGCDAFGAYWAGQGAALAREMPAAKLVADILRQI
ncbi:nitronate monooxygenase [Mesorhizobium opportunistum]|uniref:NAD(P)H-dependent flavin oxidoreductase n=1 Tax=Mesorhizobium opportunistum TaxID=593909 RepID=UPI0033352BF1